MEYPEIQVITVHSQDRMIQAKFEQASAPGSDDRYSVSPARKRFIVAVFKVVSELAAQRDRKTREEEQERRQQSSPKQQNNKSGTLPPLTRQQSRPSRAQSPKKPQKHGAHPSICSETSIQKQAEALLNRVPDELPDIPAKAPETAFARRTGGMHLSSIVRLERFRKMMAKRLNSSQSAEESDPDDDAEDELPQKPRFSATLSPEAQYAMMKGYEDILLDYLRPSKPQSNYVLYRVRTPHKKVISLKVVEDNWTTAKTIERQYQQRHLLSPSDAKSSHRLDKLMPRQGARSAANGVTSLPDGRRQRIRRNACAEDAQKVKEIRLTSCFQKAMAIIDTIRTSQGWLVTSPRDRKLFRNPLKVYNKWSQGWNTTI
ncbi:hypothetical protein LSH36_2g06024 [Paralvinella palmiformis]|uniref:Uncharacterized protein n=1 Tax=Paralvinella palmiformis TaxID=53620 RepID=A0AAD9KGV8_9ANNE|nr:hypothetical protein LSH36_2g06024 [Paralvinella palmiformis]